jgi:V8-like Glu-specific endopeptidase
MATVGSDNRTPIYRPEGKIGRVFADSKDDSEGYIFGTGTLVGRFTAITNAHIVKDWVSTQPQREGEFVNPRFEAGFVQGTALDQIPVDRWTWYNESTETSWEDDFAIITFAEPIGDRFGWYKLSSRAATTNNFGESVTMRGYSADIDRGEIPSVAGGVAFGNGAQAWRHDLDSFGGSSGSAIVSNNDGKVLGLNWAEPGKGNSSNLNYWTPITDAYISKIAELEAEAQAQYQQRADKLTGQPRVVNQAGNVPNLKSQQLDTWDRNQRNWADDRQGKAWYVDRFQLLDFPGGKSIRVDMSSEDFDTFLQIVDLTANKTVAQNGDFGGSNASSITFTAEPGHKYDIYATSMTPDIVGKYSLNASIL